MTKRGTWLLIALQLINVAAVLVDDVNANVLVVGRTVPGRLLAAV